jgi:ankyrin repeat protein
MKLTEQIEIQNLDLFDLARKGQVELLKNKILENKIQSKCDINQKNEKGHSALMLTAYNGHFEATKYLISAGADVNSVDQSTNSILMGVVFKGHSQIFDILIQAGANLDYENNKEQTALDYAIMFGRRELITKINQIQNSNRQFDRVDQVKTWFNYIKN